MRTALRHTLGFPPDVIAIKLQIAGESNFLYVMEDSSSSHPSLQVAVPQSRLFLTTPRCSVPWLAVPLLFRDDAPAFPGLREESPAGTW